MTPKRFGRDQNALETRFAAQRLAFAPVVFQATRLLRSTGLLAAVEEAGAHGIAAGEAAQRVGLSSYGATVLLECGLSAELVALEHGRYGLTALGAFVLHDEMTGINLDFMHDVCYLGLHRLDEAIRDGVPAGLAVFGEHATVYEALSKLPERARESWFRFDHFYSDGAFPAALRAVFGHRPATLLDIGANTGKWALQCLSHSAEVRLTLADLPGQLAVAMRNLREAGLDERATPWPVDLLDAEARLPAGFDAVWMSQFLMCFSEPEITAILCRVAGALTAGGRVWILDTFWDEQRYDAAAYCLINTSPYFTAIANGNSRMYKLSDLLECARQAGLSLVGREPIGLYHSLLELVPAAPHQRA